MILLENLAKGIKVQSIGADPQTGPASNPSHVCVSSPSAAELATPVPRNTSKTLPLARPPFQVCLPRRTLAQARSTRDSLSPADGPRTAPVFASTITPSPIPACALLFSILAFKKFFIHFYFTHDYNHSWKNGPVQATLRLSVHIVLHVDLVHRH